jgi:hypothetical protein
MNASNRVFVIICLVALLLLGAFVLVTPAGFLGLTHTLANTFRANVFAAYSDTGRLLVRIILAIVWVALMIFLLWLEVRRPGTRTIEIARSTGGSTIRISTAAVADKIKEQVNAVAGVIDAKVNATGRNRAVEVKLDVVAAKDVDLLAKAEEVAAVTRQVVEDQLGLKLTGKPQVAIKASQSKAPSKPALSTLPSTNPQTPPDELPPTPPSPTIEPANTDSPKSA